MRYHIHIRVFMSLRAYFSLSKCYKKEEREEPKRDFPFFSGVSCSLLVLSVEYVQALVPLEDVPSGRAPTFSLEGAKHIHETSMGY
jgi:hypothetical protein